MPYNPDRINIHELTVEEPEKQEGLPFDPERDITEKGWNYLKSEFESQHDGNLWFFSYTASQLKILDPLFDLRITPEIWESFGDSLNAIRHHTVKNWDNFSATAARMKIIDNDKNLNINQNDWRSMQQKLDKLRKQRLWGAFAVHAASMKILDPRIDFKVDEETRRDMIKEIKNETTFASIFAEHAAAMKILGIAFEVDKFFWRMMQEELKEEQAQGKSFSKLAVDMKILVAEEVEVTDKGLEITMPKPKEDLKQGIQHLPEVKQF